MYCISPVFTVKNLTLAIEGTKIQNLEKWYAKHIGSFLNWTLIILSLDKEPFLFFFFPSMNDVLDLKWSSFGAIQEMLSEISKCMLDSNCFLVLKNCD